MTDDALATWAIKHQVTFIQETVTHREGDDTSPMTLPKEKTDWATLPPIGTQIKAHGPNDWIYWGVVIEHGADGQNYTIRVTSATNRRMDNARLSRRYCDE